jgi:hypothetical protein
MSTTAGELLDIMTTRLGMQQDGVTNPSDSVKKATRDLVEKLTPLNRKEKIKLVAGAGIEAQYVRASTGEVLAEIKDEDTEQ